MASTLAPRAIEIAKTALGRPSSFLLPPFGSSTRRRWPAAAQAQARPALSRAALPPCAHPLPLCTPRARSRGSLRPARMLKTVAEQGPGVFYGGKVGEWLVKDEREVGGILTAKDLKRYRDKVRRPLMENVMGLQVITMAPPSSRGAGMLLILRMDGKLKATIGAIGDAMISAGTIEVFLNHFVKNMDPLASVMAPRVYHQV